MASQALPTEQAPSPLTAAVTEATVGRTLTFSATVTQETQPLASNSLSGVVTDVADTSAVDVGSPLFAVGNRYVRVVEGTTPFWRDLARGAQGPDVRQVEDALQALGFLHVTPDDRFASATERAVRAWQRELGVEETGSVPLGELIAVPALPAQLRLGPDVRLGMSVAGGEEAVFGFVGNPKFALVLTKDQERLVPSTAAITVSHDGTTWDAVIVSSQFDDTGNSVLTLSAPDGGPVCADACSTLPVTDRLTLQADVVVVPEVTGPAVPAAAIRTAADATSYVQTPDGTRIPVTVVGASGGVAVVDGVDPGVRVLLSPAGD